MSSRRFAPWFALSTLAIAACSGTSSNPAPHALPAPARTQTAAASGAISISFVVPAAAATGTTRGDAATRLPDFISPSARSVVIDISEPEVEQTELQEREETSSFAPGPVVTTIYAPPGDVTLRLRLYDGANGAGNILASTNAAGETPEPITVEPDATTPATVTFNPVIHSVAPVPFNIMEPGVPNFEDLGCESPVGAAQMAFLGLDADGNATWGPGTFLDVNLQKVTVGARTATRAEVAQLFAPAEPPSYQLPIAVKGTVTEPSQVTDFAYSPYLIVTYGDGDVVPVGTWYATATSSSTAVMARTVLVGAVACIAG